MFNASWTRDSFNEDHEVALGIDYGSLMLRIEGKVIKLQIWDTAGQEPFQSVVKVFYKGAECISLVYNIINDQTTFPF